MKRFFTLLLAVTFISSGMVFGQEQEAGTSLRAGRVTTFAKNNFWDNWFIGAGGTANIYFGRYDSDADLMDRVAFAPNFQIGKWLDPYSGFRVKAAGMTNLHTFGKDADIMQRNKYVSIEANYMWDMTNYLMRYNSKRFYSFIPYAGFGWAYAWDYENRTATAAGRRHVNSVTVDAGIINRFRFSERLSLDIELSGKGLRYEFDDESNKSGKKENFAYDILGSVSANLVYTLSKKANFTEAVLRDQSEIDALNATINGQRAEIDALKNRRPEQPKEIIKEVIKEVVKCDAPANNIVQFAINKTSIESRQEVQIYNIAQYLKENPAKKVRIVGYADKGTGNATINERLSQGRAKNVATMLSKKYGINTDRIQVQWEGQKNQPFNVNNWNRCVIMNITD